MTFLFQFSSLLMKTFKAFINMMFEFLFSFWRFNSFSWSRVSTNYAIEMNHSLSFIQAKNFILPWVSKNNWSSFLNSDTFSVSFYLRSYRTFVLCEKKRCSKNCKIRASLITKFTIWIVWYRTFSDEAGSVFEARSWI